MRMFAYSVSSKGDVIVPGWLCQVNNSVGSSEFLFAPSAFPHSAKDIQKIDPGAIFIDNSHNWENPLLSNRYDYFIKHTITDSNSRPKSEQNVKTTKERFLAHLFNGITIAQKFKI